MKIRTTNVWWLFGSARSPCRSGAGRSLDQLRWQRRHGRSAANRRTRIAGGAGRAGRSRGSQVAALAANIYTSGQFFGLLFVMLLGMILVTNEFFHQTATATFLTTPQRTR